MSTTEIIAEPRIGASVGLSITPARELNQDAHVDPREGAATKDNMGSGGRPRSFKPGLWANVAWIVAWNIVTLLIFFG